MATYLPNEADEPEADIPLAIPPPVTPHEALVSTYFKLNLQPISISYNRP